MNCLIDREAYDCSSFLKLVSIEVNFGTSLGPFGFKKSYNNLKEIKSTVICKLLKNQHLICNLLRFNRLPKHTGGDGWFSAKIR